MQADRTRWRLLDGGNAGLVVDAADARGGAAARLQAVVELAAAVKVGLAADGKTHAAGDDAFGQRWQQVNAQHAAGRLFRPRVLALLPAKLGADNKAVVNRRRGERVHVLVTGKDGAP